MSKNLFRKWLAKKLSPELALTERRFWRLRSELSYDMRWLGYDFPEIDIFVHRALVNDANYGRALDEKPYSLEAGGTLWASEISQFREQLRAKFNRTPEKFQERS
jgi:hypothetical protein